MTLLLGIASFIGIIALFLGIHGLMRRNSVREAMRRPKPLSLPIAGIGEWVMRSKLWSRKSVEGMLALADYKSMLRVEIFIGALAAVAGVSGLMGLCLWGSGAIDPVVALGFPLTTFAVPWLITVQRAKRSRARLRMELFRFAARLEHAVRGGAEPVRVAVWAAEGGTLFARQMAVINACVERNVPFAEAFQQHFAEKLGLAEADEVAAVLKNAAKGVPIAGQLRELNRDFRDRRELNLLIRASKLKPSVTAILTVSTLIASTLLIIGPIIFSVLEAAQ
ncbi:MAG: hypothetical protein ACM3QZ_10455 [Solirubrobacterales bacterium]